jgi:hypothetical protein
MTMTPPQNGSITQWTVSIVAGTLMMLACKVMTLPLDTLTLNQFYDPAAVATVLRENTEGQSGVFVMRPDVTNPALAAWPSSAFIVLGRPTPAAQPGQASPPWRQWGKTVVTDLLMAALLTWLLSQGGHLPSPPLFWQRCRVAGVLGVLVACAAHMPNRIWWHFSLEYTLVEMLQTTLAITLAGVAIAGVWWAGTEHASG